MKPWVFLGAVMALYALMPLGFSQAVFWERVAAIPVGYLPILMAFVPMFLKQRFTNRRSASGAIRPQVWLLIFITVATVISLGRWVANPRGFDIASALVDVLMFIIYWLLVMATVIRWGIDAGPEQLNQLLSNSVLVIAGIVILGIGRHFFVDAGTAPFFNLFNPLRYRLFEVLILTAAGAVALGWYLAERRLRFLAAFLTITGGILLAGSRTGYLVYAILLLPYLYYAQSAMVLLRAIPLVIAAAGLTWQYANDAVLQVVERMRAVGIYLTLDFERALAEDSVVRRIGMMRGTIDIFLAEPIFGIGLGKENYFVAFPEKYLDYFHIGRPHNQYLMVAASSGVVGLVLFYAFVISIIRLLNHGRSNLANNRPLRVKAVFLLMLQVQILGLMIGYELETQPFTWLIWGLSVAFGTTLARYKPTQQGSVPGMCEKQRSIGQLSVRAGGNNSQAHACPL